MASRAHMSREQKGEVTTAEIRGRLTGAHKRGFMHKLRPQEIKDPLGYLNAHKRRQLSIAILEQATKTS